MVRRIIGKIYSGIISNILIVVIVQFIIFLLLQIIDFFVECFYFDNDIYIFFYLKYLFFGFSLIVQAVVLISIIVCFSFLGRIEGNADVENKVYSTFVKIITAIYTFWSIILIATFLPRIFMLVIYREKIGIFISVLIYLKVFFMISIYLDLLVMYILNKEKNLKKK